MLQIHTNDEAKRQWTHMHISFCSSFSYTRVHASVYTHASTSVHMHTHQPTL